MITIEYRDGAHMLSLVLNGHACAGNYGNDIVCASASMLAYTLAGDIRTRYEAGELQNEPIIVLTSGSARIKCVPFAEDKETVKAAYELIAGGYRMLADRYPEYVRYSRINGDTHG